MVILSPSASPQAHAPCNCTGATYRVERLGANSRPYMFAAMLERAIALSQAPLKQIEQWADETAVGVDWTGPLRGSNER